MHHKYIHTYIHAGTPAIAECIGLGAACDYLSNLGMDKVEKWEKELSDYLYEKLHKVHISNVYVCMYVSYAPYQYKFMYVCVYVCMCHVPVWIRLKNWGKELSDYLYEKLHKVHKRNVCMLYVCMLYVCIHVCVLCVCAGHGYG
jgi:hypothetical protein